MMFFAGLIVAVVISAVSGLPIKSEDNCWVGGPQWEGQPQQVHLSWWGDATQMWVTWVTEDIQNVNESIVEYWLEESKVVKASGSVDTFVDGGSEKRKIYMHRACMTNLKPNTKYYYHVGCFRGWSNKFSFTSLPDGEDWSPRIAVFGDLGNYNGISIGPLQDEVQHDKLDMVWHVGDFAYNMDMANGRCGDLFMRQIEPIAGYVPYQTVVGNHENAYNFSNYKARFTMPKNGDGENMFYSYNLGPAHIIAYSGEFYYFTNYGTQQIANQLAWLKNDLMEAAKPENRAKRPWIIALSHRPMYCSAMYGGDCLTDHALNRVALETLFYDHGVDLHFFAHEHSYERLWPVYDKEVYNGSLKENPYDNPGAPVHITSGSAGCLGPLDGFIKNPKKWSARRFSAYGYGHLNIHNKTHISWEQIAVKEGKVMDKMILIKDSHGPYVINQV